MSGTLTSSQRFEQELARGERFAFGANWRRFHAVLNEQRIVAAERSLKDMLGVETLAGKSFLDIGNGSGLFSLAALRLGAARVFSFDYDPNSVGCALELRRRYFPGVENWTIEQGSVLDQSYLDHLGQWDVVYSWGVLHHTGDMWQALSNAVPLVKDEGLLFISIYNDQGDLSRYWKLAKALYNRWPLARGPMLASFLTGRLTRAAVLDILRLRNPALRYIKHESSRGMSVLHDARDWLGGYPFEVAKPEEIFSFFQARRFLLSRLVTCRGTEGCNQFVFQKVPSSGGG